MLIYPLPEPTISTRIPSKMMQAVPTLIYYGALSSIPHTVGKPSFVPIVVLLRTLLFCPFLFRTSIFQSFLGSRAVPLRDVHQSYPMTYRAAFVCSGVLVVRQTISATQENSVREVFGAVNNNPAVSALGYDFILHLIGFCAYFLVCDSQIE